MRSIVEKLRDLTLDKDERLLREYDLIDSGGNLTHEGQSAVMDYMFKKVKADIVNDLQELEKNAKVSKKVRESR